MDALGLAALAALLLSVAIAAALESGDRLPSTGRDRRSAH